MLGVDLDWECPYQSRPTGAHTATNMKCSIHSHVYGFLEKVFEFRKQSFGATVCKTVRPMLSVRCLSCLSVCNVGVLWPNGWTDQDETWRAGRPRPWPHCVRWGPSSPFPKEAQPPPNFRPISVAAKWLHGSRCHLVWS